MQVVVRAPAAPRGALAEWQEQVRVLVVGQHDGHRPLDVGEARRPPAASWLRWRTRRRRCINRISASTPWSAIADRSRAPVSGRIRAQVRLFGNVHRRARAR